MNKRLNVGEFPDQEFYEQQSRQPPIPARQYDYGQYNTYNIQLPQPQQVQSYQRPANSTNAFPSSSALSKIGILDMALNKVAGYKTDAFTEHQKAQTAQQKTEAIETAKRTQQDYEHLVRTETEERARCMQRLATIAASKRKTTAMIREQTDLADKIKNIDISLQRNKIRLSKLRETLSSVKEREQDAGLTKSLAGLNLVREIQEQEFGGSSELSSAIDDTFQAEADDEGRDEVYREILDNENGKKGNVLLNGSSGKIDPAIDDILAEAREYVPEENTNDGQEDMVRNNRNNERDQYNDKGQHLSRNIQPGYIPSFPAFPMVPNTIPPNNNNFPFVQRRVQYPNTT